MAIGRSARRVDARAAEKAIFGYAVANDVTMSDFQYRTHQWLQGKAWDRSTPLRPCLVTADELGRGDGLDLRITLNGKEVQYGNTSQMIFDVPTLVSTVSQFTTLNSGDIILTGTPGGVGHRREPPVYLQPGDTVRVEVEGVGALENRVEAEDAQILPDEESRQ